MLIVWVWVWMTLWLGRGQVDASCNVCQCRPSEVDCSSQDLDVVPDLDPDSNLTTLSLAGNLIRRVQPFPELPALTNLSLKNNLISIISPKAFYNLTSLVSLDLSQNHLTYEQLKPTIFKGPFGAGGYETLNINILRLGSNSLHSLHPDLFEYIPHVEELYLNLNPFGKLDTVTMIAIVSLHKLKILDLSSTGLKDLPPGMLHTPRFLNYLNLQLNNFTSVPSGLEDSLSLQELVLNANPIKVLSYFPRVENLKVLHLSSMVKLTRIEDWALSNLTSLQVFNCTHNYLLVHISGKTFQKESEEGAKIFTYPPIEKLYLNDNRLGYLEQETLGRWDVLKDLTLDYNPWVCDCENQWILNVLIPITLGEKSLKKASLNLTCAAPKEMAKMTFLSLYHKDYSMRCLDLYSNHPENDAKVLIVVLVAALVSVPIALGLLAYIRRAAPPINHHYPRAYYIPAGSVESVA